MLTAEDLAYMRDTQDDARPTPASLVRRTETPDGMGGETSGDAAPLPIHIRVKSADRTFPNAIVEQFGTSLVGITMDLVEVSSGDHVTVTPTETYEVVSQGAVQDWTTAQQVYAVRSGERQT